eukprot:maker-scaffold_5-snap-gene-2.42-mRNA-1 protein AED:0.22 eAED:0.24 QI:0/0/0/0.75/1/1/4/0/1515
MGKIQHLVLIFNLILLPYVARGNEVSVQLQSNWSVYALNPYAEIGESLKSYNNDLFLKYVELVSLQETEEESNPTFEQNYELSLQLLRGSLTFFEMNEMEQQSIFRVVKMGADIRGSLPKLEYQNGFHKTLSNLLLDQADEILGMSYNIVDATFSIATSLQSLQGLFSEKASTETVTIKSKEKTEVFLQLLKQSKDNIFKVFPRLSSNAGGKKYLVFGVLGSPLFSKITKQLTSLHPDIQEGIQFMLVSRHSLVPDKLVVDHGDLPGFGVVFDIKNTEYLAINEEVDAKTERDDDIEGKGSLQKLGYIIATKIQSIKNSGEDVLGSLTSIVQNFPGEYSHLSELKLNRSITKKLRKFYDENRPKMDMFSLFAMGGAKAGLERIVNDGVILLNGKELEISRKGDLERFNLFKLHSLIREELKLQNVISKYAKVFPDPEAFKTAIHEIKPSLDQGSDDVRLNVVKGSKGAIFFMNNIEKDNQYMMYSTSLQRLLQNSRQLIPLRKNLYTSIVALDLSKPSSLALLQSFAEFYSSGVTVRFGFVLGSSDDIVSSTDRCENYCFLSLFVHIKQLKLKDKLGSWLSMVLSQHDYSTGLDVSKVLHSFEAYFSQFSQFDSSAFSITKREIKGLSNNQVIKTLELQQEYLDAKGIEQNMIVLNGIVIDEFSSKTHLNIRETFEESVPRLIYMEQRKLQMQIYKGEFSDSGDVLKNILYGGSSLLVNRYNRDILGQGSGTHFSLKVADRYEMTEIKRKKGAACKESLVFVSNFGTKETNRSLSNFLSYARHVNACYQVATDVEVTGSQQRIESWLHSNEADDGLTIDDVTHASNMVLNFWLEKKETFGEAISSHITDHLSKTSIILYNDKAFAIGTSKILYSEDFELMKYIYDRDISETRYNLQQRVAGNTQLDIFSKLQMFSAISSISETSRTLNGERDKVQALTKYPKELIIQVNSYQHQSPLEIFCELNPYKDEALYVLPLLDFLVKELNIPLTLVLLPDEKIDELPFKKFARLSLPKSEVSATASFPSSKISIKSLPTDQILSLNIISPENIMISATSRTTADIDNLLLSSVASELDQGELKLQFTLEHLLYSGHGIDVSNTFRKVAATGAQLSLVPAGNFKDRYSDTVVMRNVGYFQLQAYPGVFHLMIEEEPPFLFLTGKRDQIVKVDSFLMTANILQFKKLKSKDMVSDTSVTGQEADSSGFFSQWFSGFKENKKKNKNSVQGVYNGTIHVFSVASGALYERFLRIMISSVVASTKNDVKFWIISNFLSSNFRESLKGLVNSNITGFQDKKVEFELVSYVWPNWLNKQTEKQRIIWGYKILFLDVLFPLDVEKIVYVDADQIVRADLREIFEMDLQDNVYGFTPFCDSNKDTLGFQFWRQPNSYWVNHLRGRPYHISALFVVDLNLFRKRNVGDKLREIYSMLSRDKNSLSNLDQDLPNYAQNEIPIFSLPQEWLWCESWCSLETKPLAKTIDLCNNPLHKEPKLSMAQRVISGGLFNKSWTEMDNEIEAAIKLLF